MVKTKKMDNVETNGPQGSQEAASLRRELFALLIQHVPEEVHIDGYDEDGEVEFHVGAKDIGLTQELIAKYRPQLFSVFGAKFLGELLVRENIDQFADIITSLGDDYDSVVNRWEYKRFGIELDKENISFSFHISLVQSILNEDIEKHLKRRFG